VIAGSPWIRHDIVAGVLVNNAWSVAGDPARSRVNAFFIQPFFNLNLPKHTYLVTAPEITADWVKNRWTVPVGGGAGAILKLGPLPPGVSTSTLHYEGELGLRCIRRTGAP
jgi:hypothetical protein